MENCNIGLNEHHPYLKSHSHSCNGDHHAHHHDHRSSDKKVLKIALIITIITMVLEFIYGFLSNSLALISDAIHMFTHSFALIISLFAIIIASKEAQKKLSFGYYRVEVLAALINGITIVLSIIWIVYEAFDRFINPQTIDIKLAMVVATIGLVVNIITGFILMQGDRENINLISSPLQMLSVALSSVAIIIGYVVIYYTSWYFINLFLALIVDFVIGKWPFDILKRAIHTLLEGSHIDIDEVRNHLLEVSNVIDVHDIHIWEITQDMNFLTAHIKINKDELDRYQEILKSLNSNLKHKYKIVHTTFQFEW